MNRFASLVLVSALAVAAGCSGNVSPATTGGSGGSASTGPTATTSTGSSSSGTVERITSAGVSKIDLLLMVDNSRSMADKQQILALAVPDLLNGLVNPRCVDQNGMPGSMQPSGPLAQCPTGTHRELTPVLDVHVGLLSSSLGSFGADACPDKSPSACQNGATSTSNNDHGHLVTRQDPCGPGDVATWQNEGFLAWDPAQQLNPPGESQLGDSSTPGTLIGDLHALVVGDGQFGCGFESQNESWYRFLVDPNPYQTISLQGQNAQTSGIDQQLLQQRADFMRSDSLLAVVVVTDETDTSLREESFFPLFAELLENNQPFHLPTARSECTTKGPNDPCCASCGENAPQGCPQSDPACTAASTYTDATENLGLRAFGLSGGKMSHRARYGIEFFYQPSRYVQALTSPMVMAATGAETPNPIFSVNPNDPNAAIRDPSLVLYATITGVPWQLISRQKNGVPDLINGVSDIDPTQVGGFKTAQELMQNDPQGHSYWDDIAGDPEHYVLPISPFMQESTVPRTGTDPITGTAISPPSSPNGTNAINGHEWNIPEPAGDIEYACTFPILAPIDCSQPGAVCDCTGQANMNNPLCDPNPNDNGKLTLQSHAKAYPGVKNLAIARGMGDQGIVGSICAKQLSDNTQPDYGYRPAVTAILDRIKQALQPRCLPKALTHDASGQVACSIVEASKSTACSCNSPGRAPVPAKDAAIVTAIQQDPLATVEQWNCFCEIEQTAGAALKDCQNDQTVQPSTNGWCYVDTTTGNPALVASCPSTEQHQLRFVGAGTPAAGATAFLACQ